MSDYIENVSIKVKVDSSNALKSLKFLSEEFLKIKNLSIDIGKNLKIKNIDASSLEKLSDKFKQLEDESAKTSSKIILDFKDAAEATSMSFSKAFSDTINIINGFGSIFGKIFKSIVGFDSFGGMLKQYVRDNLNKEWFDISNQRRITSNKRSNTMVDLLSHNFTSRYDNILYGKDYVGNPQSVQIYHRTPQQGIQGINSNYDRNIFNRNNYLPFSNRWRIANKNLPFDENDLKNVKEFLNAFDNLRYQIILLTRDWSRTLLPIATELFKKFTDLIKTSEAFRKALTFGFALSQISKLIKMVELLNKSLAITSTISLLKNPVALGAIAAGGAGYGLYKYFRNRKRQKESENNPIMSLNELGPFSGMNKVINDNSSGRNNTINYNINSLQVNSNANSVNSLINDIRTNTTRHRDNTFLMNNANYGGIY